MQVLDLVNVIGQHTGISSAVVDPYSRNTEAMKSQIVIGTWTSMHVLLNKGKGRLQTHYIGMVVIDELDYSLLQNVMQLFIYFYHIVMCFCCVL